MYSKSFSSSALFLVATLLLFGCVSEVQQPANATALTNQQENATVLFNIGQVVNAKNYSFVASAWGFAPEWCEKQPQSGAKFLWVYANATNTGGVPITVEDTPNEIRLIYRGIEESEQSRLANCEPYHLPLGSPVLSVSPMQFFPGTSNQGYLLFEVPESLGSGEASISIEIDGDQYELLLNEPTQYSGMHLFIKNTSFVSCRMTSTYPNHEYTCYLHISAINDVYVPNPISLMLSGGVPIKPTVDNTPLRSFSSLPTAIDGLNYMESKEVATQYGILASEVHYNNQGAYFWSRNSSVPIGMPGEVIAIHICDSCSPETVDVELPSLPSEFYD